MSICIEILIDGELVFDGELDDSAAAVKVAAVLPVEGPLHEFGDEIGVALPVDLPLDESDTNEVRVGDIAYWPPGESLTLFLGATPLTDEKSPDRVIASSAVKVVGRLGQPAPIASGAQRIEIRRVAARPA